MLRGLIFTGLLPTEERHVTLYPAVLWVHALLMSLAILYKDVASERPCARW